MSYTSPCWNGMLQKMRVAWKWEWAMYNTLARLYVCTNVHERMYIRTYTNVCTHKYVRIFMLLWHLVFLDPLNYVRMLILKHWPSQSLSVLATVGWLLQCITTRAKYHTRRNIYVRMWCCRGSLLRRHMNGSQLYEQKYATGRVKTWTFWPRRSSSAEETD